MIDTNAIVMTAAYMNFLNEVIPILWVYVIAYAVWVLGFWVKIFKGEK